MSHNSALYDQLILLFPRAQWNLGMRTPLKQSKGVPMEVFLFQRCAYIKRYCRGVPMLEVSMFQRFPNVTLFQRCPYLRDVPIFLAKGVFISEVSLFERSVCLTLVLIVWFFFSWCLLCRKHLLNSPATSPAPSPATNGSSRPSKPRPLRPRSKNMVIDWFLREEKEKGSGLDPATGNVAPWFHGQYW
jgi:hypothetical protein